MPLSEFHRGKPESNHNGSSDLSPFMPDNEFAELLRVNGRIVMQGQPNKPKKTTFPTPFPYDNIKIQEKEGRDAAIPKIGFFETMDSSMANIDYSSLSVPVPSGLHPQVDDMDPWISYQSEEDPFCSEFFSELSGIPNFLSNDRNNGLGFREGQEPNRSKSSQLFQSPQQCQTSIPSSRPRVTDFSASGGSTSSSRRLNSLGHFQKLLQVGGGVKNFSSFSRPVMTRTANDDHIGRLKSTKEASAAASTNPVESTLTDHAGVRGSSTTDLAKKELKPRHVSVETSEAFVLEGTFRNNHRNNVATNNKSAPEAKVASSVCSGSSPGAGSNDAESREKRKIREANESGYLSEDLEDDSFGAKRPPTVRAGASTKRSRAAQVHNLSERRRRDRINEKMRALQELIPNCNKVDKASMLDEAIEYLKTLQLQVQMMSMRGGLCMSPMMLPPGMQHFRAPPMAHFSPMGLGMGMGYGMGTFYMNGSPGCPIIPVPPMQAPQFPFSPISMRRAQLFSPFPGLATKGNSMNEVSGTMVHQMPISDADPSSSCKDRQQQQQNMNLEATQKTSTSESQV